MRASLINTFLVALLATSCGALSPHTTGKVISKNSAGSRRSFMSIAAGIATSPLLLDRSSNFQHEANAFPFGNEEHRQLELCLVTILRVRYWGENVSTRIQQKIDKGPVTTDLMKAPYLEARLGGKAALTGKIGGGANLQVYNLASFQVRGCVKDAESYFNDYYKKQLKSNAVSGDDKGRLKVQKKLFDDASVDIIESLAALCEFDGLENLTDPSPRSSLALTQYTNKKALFLKRILLERTVPACNTVISSFGTDTKRFVESYVAKTYPNETPMVI